MDVHVSILHPRLPARQHQVCERESCGPTGENELCIETNRVHLHDDQREVIPLQDESLSPTPQLAEPKTPEHSAALRMRWRCAPGEFVVSSACSSVVQELAAARAGVGGIIIFIIVNESGSTQVALAAVPARLPSPVQLAAGPGGCRRVGRLKDRLPTFAYTLNMQFLQYEIVLFTKLPEGSVSFAVWRPMGMAADPVPDVSYLRRRVLPFRSLACCVCMSI